MPRQEGHLAGDYAEFRTAGPPRFFDGRRLDAFGDVRGGAAEIDFDELAGEVVE